VSKTVPLSFSSPCVVSTTCGLGEHMSNKEEFSPLVVVPHTQRNKIHGRGSKIGIISQMTFQFSTILDISFFQPSLSHIYEIVENYNDIPREEQNVEL
jgi:hypothetical protein